VRRSVVRRDSAAAREAACGCRRGSLLAFLAAV
jgi:hypothetical protein